MKVVVWKDGSHRFFEDNRTREVENDPDWLVTISMPWRDGDPPPDGLQYDEDTWRDWLKHV